MGPADLKVDATSVAVVREIGETLRALFWPAAVVGLAILFRHSLALLLARASAVSVTTPLGGVSVAARVVGLLSAARATRAGTGGGVLWVDGVPDHGAAERAALSAAGIGIATAGSIGEALARIAGGDAPRVTVLAGDAASDADDVRQLVAARGGGGVVLYPDPGRAVPRPIGAEVAVCTDPASLFVAVASQFRDGASS